MFLPHRLRRALHPTLRRTGDRPRRRVRLLVHLDQGPRRGDAGDDAADPGRKEARRFLLRNPRARRAPSLKRHPSCRHPFRRRVVTAAAPHGRARYRIGFARRVRRRRSGPIRRGCFSRSVAGSSRSRAARSLRRPRLRLSRATPTPRVAAARRFLRVHGRSLRPPARGGPPEPREERNVRCPGRSAQNLDEPTQKTRSSDTCGRESIPNRRRDPGRYPIGTLGEDEERLISRGRSEDASVAFGTDSSARALTDRVHRLKPPRGNADADADATMSRRRRQWWRRRRGWR